MASTLEKIRKARQGSETSLASADIKGTSGTSASSSSSSLARLRAARAAQSQPTLTSAAQIYASDEEKKRQEEEKNRGGPFGGAGYVAEKIGLGIAQGVEGIFDFAIGGVADIFGADDFAERQFANDWFNYSHADEWYNPGEGWKVAGDVAGGIGSSIPTIATAAAVTYFTGGAGAGIAATLVAGTSAGGTAVKEAYQETGELTGKEWGYGILSGATEAAIEKISGGIFDAGASAIGKRIGQAFGKTAAKEVGKTTVKSVAVDLGKNFLSEAFEEGFSEMVSPWYKRMTYDPNAKNATAGEIGYAALVGGLSGLITSGAGTTVTQVSNIRKGAKAEASGSVGRIKAISEVILEASGDKTDVQSVNAVRDLYYDLTEGSLKITEGEKLTVPQKRALGELQNANMAAIFEPKMAQAAGNAVKNAEAVVERLNSYGNIKMADGRFDVISDIEQYKADNPDVEVRDITAEDLRAGFDEKGGKQALAKAIQNNEVLRYVAASDVAGRLIMSVEQFEKTALEGTNIKNQVDLNKFIEEASPEKKRALGAELGIAENEWDTLQLGRLNEAVRSYRESGKTEAYKSRVEAVNKAKSVDESAAKKKIPSTIGLGDGKVERYKIDKVDIAVYRNGDSFVVFDYNENAPSRALSRAEVNSVLEQMRNGEGAVVAENGPSRTPVPTGENTELTSMNRENVQVSDDGEPIPASARRSKETVDTSSTADAVPLPPLGKAKNESSSEKAANEKVADLKERIDAEKIDAELRESVADYDSLKEADRSMVRKVVREGRVHGLSEADILSYARVAAHTGINIEYDANLDTSSTASGPPSPTGEGKTAGYYDPKANKIVVNPKATKKQELILIHELDHAVRKLVDLGGNVHTLVYEGAEKGLSKETWKQIEKDYADQNVDVSREELLADEASAYYTEAILGGKVTVDMLLGKNGPSGTPVPTVKKILNFFTSAARAYSKDEKLSRAARRHYKSFKAMFGAFAKANQGRNAETAVERPGDGKAERKSSDFETKLFEVDEKELSKRTFSYKELVAKGDLTGIVIGKKVQVKVNNGVIDKAWVATEVKKKCETLDTKGGTTYFANAPDIGKKVEITNDGITHGFARPNDIKNGKSTPSAIINARVALEIPQLLRNSIEVNRSKRGNNIDVPYTHVMMGTVALESDKGDIEYYAVRSMVEERVNQNPVLIEANVLGKLYAVNAKKIDSPNAQVAKNSVALTHGRVYTYSIAQFLQDVKGVFDDTFSVDVYKQLGAVRKSNDFSKNLRFSKDITPKVAEESGIEKSIGKLGEGKVESVPALRVFDKHGRNIEAVRSMSETKFRADILKRFRYSNADNVRERDFIDYHLGRNALEVIDMKTITEAPEVPEVSGTLKDNVQRLKLDGNAMNIDIGAVAITPVRIKDFNTRELSDTDVKLLYLTKSIIENGRVVAFSHPEGVFFEEIKIAARVKLNGKYTYAEVTVHRNDEGGTPYVYDVEASSDVKKSLSKASKPATYKRLYEKLGVGTAVTETEHLDTETGDIVLPPEIYTALKNNLRSVQISDALYKKILVKSDKITATKLKATWSYNPKYEAQRKIKAYSKGKQFTERQTVSAEEFVKGMSDLLQIPGVSANDVAGSLVKLDRIYRVNREGGKAYRAEIENERLKEKLGERFFKKLQNIAHQIKHLKDLSEGTFLNSTEYNIDDFKAALAPLHRIEYRGNLVDSKVRESMKAFSKWYKPDNPMLASMDGNPDSALYSEYIGDMVKRLANGDTGLSIFELDQLDLILRHATHIVENFNRVWKNGKWVKADDTAKGFVGVADSARLLRSSADMRKISRLFDNVGRRYLTAFGDPMTLFRFMDGYQDGFFTWAGEELRAGAFRHGVDVMEMKAEYDAFLEGKDHKKYVEKASREVIEYGGAKMSKLQYISLYMTMQRQQAQRGLAENGFSLIDVNGQRVEVDGFLSRIQARIGSELGIKKSPDGVWEITEEQMKAAVESEIAEIKKQLTEEDLQFVGIIERTLNGKCKELKQARDMERLGYSNTISGYYYPIVRAMIAKTIDSQGMWGELDRASNISANKDTVKGAAGALWIESADTVFNRHIDAVARYAELSPAIDAINKLFNLDISGNKNKPRSVRTATFNSWQTAKLFGGAPSDVQRHNGEAYLKELLADLQGIGKSAGIGESFAEGLRGGFAISALAANPKVLLTQISSVFASTNILSMKSVTEGARLGFGKGVGADVDKYCLVAKLRNYDSSAAKAQGVIENVRGAGEKLMTLVSVMDRGVVRTLWGACQVEIESTKGYKVGTEENAVEAGKLLERVIQETQQNSIATEKSAAMRSKSMLMKSLTMFTSDAMKSVGRVIDALGHRAALTTRIKAAEASGDAELVKTLRTERKGVDKQARKSIGALVMTAIYMTLIARAFSWLYAKDEEEDENSVLAFIADVFGGMLGGLPIISDIYEFFVSGYDLSDNVYDTLNGVLEGVSKVANTAGKMINGEATAADMNGAAIYFAQTVGTVLGLPIRNVRNMVMGLTRRFNPNAAYRMEMLTKSKNYASDFEEAIGAGDDDKAFMILELLLSERLVGEGAQVSFENGAYIDEVLRMEKAGYNVLPRTIGSTVTIGGEEVDVSPEEQSALRARYSEAVGVIETLIASEAYAALSDEQKESAVRFVYDVYYDQGIYELYGYERNMKRRLFAKVLSPDKLALAAAMTAGLESDYEDEKGKAVSEDKWAAIRGTTARVNYSAVSGSKRKKVIAAINKLPLTTAEKLLIIAYKGYTIKDGDVRGVSAERAKQMLSRYAKKAGLTGDEAKALESYL